MSIVKDMTVQITTRASSIMLFILALLMTTQCYRLSLIIFSSSNYQVDKWSPKYNYIEPTPFNKKIDVHVISKEDIFGHYNLNANNTSNTIKSKPIINRSIIYHGGLVGVDSRHSIAIISYKHNQHSYSISDSIPRSGITIIGIMPESLVISNNGIEEIVPLQGIDKM